MLLACSLLCLPALAQEEGAAAPPAAVLSAPLDPGLVQRQKIVDALRAKLAAMALSQNSDYDFASFMQLYDQAAAQMAAIEMREGTDGDMKALARQTLAAGRKRDAKLDTWIAQFRKFN